MIVNVVLAWVGTNWSAYAPDLEDVVVRLEIPVRNPFNGFGMLCLASGIISGNKEKKSQW